MSKYIVVSPVKYGSRKDPETNKIHPEGAELSLTKEEAEQLGKAVCTPKEYAARKQAKGLPDAEALLARIAELEAENEALRETLEGQGEGGQGEGGQPGPEGGKTSGGQLAV